MIIEITDHADLPKSIHPGKYELIIDLKPMSWASSMEEMKKKKITPLSRVGLSFLCDRNLIPNKIESQFLWTSTLDYTNKYSYSFHSRLGFVNHTSITHYLRGIGIRRSNG